MHITDKVRTFFKERWPYYAAWLLGIIFSVFVFHAFRDNLLDADMSSEMILGKLLGDEGGLFSERWLYSTEIRVFNVQLIYKYLFCFMNDWHWVRTLAIAVILLLLAFSYAFFSERMQLGTTGLLCGLFLMVPFCMQYGQFVLYIGVYFPHVVYMLLALALAMRFRSFAVSGALLLCNMLLAFCNGLGGVRGALFIYIPIVLTAVCLFGYYRFADREQAKREDLRDKLRYLLVTSGMLLLSYIPALLINAKILSRHYSFVNFAAEKQQLHFELFGLMKYAFESFVSVFGSKYYFNILCDSDIRIAAAALFAVLLLSALFFLFVGFKRLRFEHQFILLFTCIGFACNTGACYITGNTAVRYVMLSLLMFIPVLAIFLNCLKERRLKAAYNFAVVTTAVYLSLQLAVFCRYPFFHDDVPDSQVKLDSWVHCPTAVHCGYHREAADWLVKHGWTQGFATFWHSNLITEYSDGKIEMWTLRNGPVFAYLDKEWVNFRVEPWLQFKRHAEKMPEGKVFLLLSGGEAAQDKRRLYTDAKYLIYKNAGLRVYGYDSYESILANLFGKNLNAMIDVYSPAGKPEKGSGERLRLKNRRRASGPKLTLPKGRYVLRADCSLSGRRKLAGQLRYWAKGRIYKLPFRLREGINEIPFELDSDSVNWGIDIVNKGKDNAFINRTELIRVGGFESGKTE